MIRARAILLAAACLAGPIWGHGSPYVSFACGVLDGERRPAAGLTAVLDAMADGAEAAARAEAPVIAGRADIAMRFAGDFSGRLRLRILDAKRRPLAFATGPAAEFRYAHRYGARPEAVFAARMGGTAADPLRDGEAVLGGDGRVHAAAGAAPAFVLARIEAVADSSEAAEDTRGKELDRGIDAEFRARLDAIRKRREAR